MSERSWRKKRKWLHMSQSMAPLTDWFYSLVAPLIMRYSKQPRWTSAMAVYRNFKKDSRTMSTGFSRGAVFQSPDLHLVGLKYSVASPEIFHRGGHWKSLGVTLRTKSHNWISDLLWQRVKEASRYTLVLCFKFNVTNYDVHILIPGFWVPRQSCFNVICICIDTCWAVYCFSTRIVVLWQRHSLIWSTLIVRKKTL